MTAGTILRDTGRTSPGFDVAMLSLRPALQRHALRLTKNHAAADDLVQDTFARAWGARTRFESGTNMRAWLFRIARNAFLSGLRRSRRQVPWDTDRHDQILVQAPMQDEALYARDLNAALARLPRAQHCALELIAIDGMSMADAAGELGIPVGTVKSRVARGRASIMVYFGEHAPRDTAPAIGQIRKDKHSVLSFHAARRPPRPAQTLYERWKASGATMIG